MIRKNKFLTFCCACIPGVGQMYQGYMKRGVSLMILFWGIAGLSGVLYMPILSFFLPVIWAYSFFDVMNKWNWTIEQLSLMEDKPIFDMPAVMNFSNRHKWVGIAVIVFGIILLYNVFASTISSVLYDIFGYTSIHWMTRILPTVVIAVIVILFGIKLVRGPRDGGEKQ